MNFIVHQEIKVKQMPYLKKKDIGLFFMKKKC